MAADFRDALGMLACPVCHGTLALDGSAAVVCTSCRRVYPVVDEIPVLLPDRAKQCVQDDS